MDASAESIKSTLQQWLEDRQKSLQEVLTVTLEEELGRLRPDDALVQRLMEPFAAAQAAAHASANMEEIERNLGAALDHLEKAPTQAEALKALMDGMSPLAARCALFIVKQGVANLFTHRGYGPDAPRGGVQVPANPGLEPLLNGSALRLAGGPGYAALAAPLGGAPTAEGMVFPLRLRRKVVALVLVDGGDRPKLDHPSLLQALVLAAESTLSQLAAAAQEAGGTPPGSITQAIPVMPGAEPHRITAPMAPSDAKSSGPMAATDIRSSQPMAPVAPRPTAPPMAAPPVALPPAPAMPVVPPPTPAQPLSANDLVMPATEAPPQDELDPKIRATAERLARVLVGDIELYFPQKVAQGKQNGNLYGLLREELDRSRHTFIERFGPEVEARHRIFVTTVVNLLCDADPARLGKAPWN
jgi:hypothetical protein